MTWQVLVLSSNKLLGQLGQTMPTADLRRSFEADDPGGPALDAFNRMVTHLEANEVDLEKTPITAGRWLTFDPETETPTAADARPLATREYRSPFVVEAQA